MKTYYTYLVILLTLVVTTNSLSQEIESGQKLMYKTGNPADWPAELDAVIAAPNNHKILLENENVRVLEVTMAPGEIEPLHHHRWPSTLYITEAGHFTDSDGDGNIIFDSREIPEALTLPLTMYKKPEAPHTVTNLSKTKRIKLIRVEIKSNESNQNMHVIDGLYQAFAIGDIPSVLSAMDKNIVWNEAESNSLAVGNPYLGPEAVLKGVFAPIGEQYESFSLKDIKLHEMNNNQVLATLYYVIKAKNGKKYTVQAAHHWTLKDAKIIGFQQYADTKKLAEADMK